MIMYLLNELYRSGITPALYLFDHKPSCILLYLVTQLADRERQQLGPFKYYPYHAERRIRKLYNKINTKQTAAYMYELVV